MQLNEPGTYTTLNSLKNITTKYQIIFIKEVVDKSIKCKFKYY